MIIVEKLSPIIPNSNPFDYDLFRMGTTLNKNFIAMYGLDEDDIILVHNKTGQRMRIKFDNDRESNIVVENYDGLRQEYNQLAKLVNQVKRKLGE